MRQIGTLPEERDARRLADYLLTLDITTRLDRSGDGWIVWVHHEDLVDRARRELEGFLKDPANRRYQGAAEIARARRKQAEQEEKAHARNSINLGAGQRYRPWARCRLAFILIAASVAVTVATDFGSFRVPLTRALLIAELRPAPKILVDDQGRRVLVDDPESEGSPRLEEVRRGQVWRLVTPIFIHFSLIHLLFNMSMTYELAGLIELRKGTWWLATLVLSTAVASDLGQYYWAHSPAFGGMSGVLYGLFGYVWMKGHYDPESGLALRQGTVNIMLLWLLLCMSGALGHLADVRVANAAHLVGLLAGVLIGFAPHAGRELRRWI